MVGIPSQIAHDSCQKVRHIILRRNFHIMPYNTDLIVWICACACQNFKAMMNVVPCSLKCRTELRSFLKFYEEFVKC